MIDITMKVLWSRNQFTSRKPMSGLCAMAVMHLSGRKLEIPSSIKKIWAPRKKQNMFIIRRACKSVSELWHISAIDHTDAGSDGYDKCGKHAAYSSLEQIHVVNLYTLTTQKFEIFE